MLHIRRQSGGVYNVLIPSVLCLVEGAFLVGLLHSTLYILIQEGGRGGFHYDLIKTNVCTHFQAVVSSNIGYMEMHGDWQMVSSVSRYLVLDVGWCGVSSMIY